MCLPLVCHHYRLRAFSELESAHSFLSRQFGVTFTRFLIISSQGTIHLHYPRVPCLRLLFRLSPSSHLHLFLPLPKTSSTQVELLRSLTCFLFLQLPWPHVSSHALLTRSFFPTPITRGVRAYARNSLYKIMFYSLGHLLMTLDHILISPWDTNSFCPSVSSSGISFLCCFRSPL